jgi:YD repeat-containing protein
MFPHKITHPVTNGVSHVDQYIYNATIGRVSSHTDENNNVTNYSFDDVGRITDIAYPIGEVKTCYTDESTNCPVSTPNSVVTTTIASPSPNVVAVKTYDGLGRKIQDVATSDPSGATKVDTTYDEYGRAIMVSTPYRSPALATDPPTGNTQTVYDALGRVIEQIQPDQSTVFACYDGLQVLFNSQNQAIQPNCQSAFQLGFGTSTWADTTDESGHHTQRVTDGLGRLSYVVESNPGGNSLSLLTQYTYDSLDNLVSVNQYGSAGLGNVATQRSRLFSYDSLSRLIYSQNPEAGQISYSYDSNSNLYQKTDARNITITYGYDALNRVVSKTYSNGEPAISYVFDNTASGANGSGRLYQEFTGTAGSPISSRTINNYDALGRITSETKCVLISQCSTSAHLYNLGFQYDQAGRLTSYGSGYGNLTFNQQYDASGRLLSVNSVQGSTTTPLFSTPVYTPAGAIATTLLGSGLNLSRIYDQRQRLLTESDTETPQVPSTTGLPSTISILGTEQAR